MNVGALVAELNVLERTLYGAMRGYGEGERKL